MAPTPAVTGSRRNAVRFELQGNLEMDRLQFSGLIIQKELGFSQMQIDYIFVLPDKKTFEAIFATNTSFETCLQIFKRLKESRPHLRNIEMVPLLESEPWVNHLLDHGISPARPGKYELFTSHI
ncbi:hypothetical protein XENORESO_017314 [Xenotaenia resolanae]|uniref:Zinc finger CCHC domain-containing protein n=1 Tax=Xenotaenia resolanae TaxID=208358 RepID=A0ABV0WBJ0_9TELE